ncbi:MAG: hypothetical protein ABFD69_15720 [Candidatus Sumerlaeia bacterium]
MRKVYQSLALLLLCAPILVLGGCVVALGNRGAFEDHKKQDPGCGCRSAMMLVSPDGKCWSVKVDNDGQLSTAPASCRGTAACKCGAKGGCKCAGKAQAAPAKPAGGCKAGGCKMQMGGGMQMQMGMQPQPEPVPSVDLGAKK